MVNDPFPLTPAEIMKRVATKGDLATVLIAAPVGFVADIMLSLSGVVSPGICAALTASTALGIKNAVQANISRRSIVVGIPEDSQPKPEILKRARSLIFTLRAEISKESDTLDLDSLAAAEETLTQEIYLFEANISDEETLSKAYAVALSTYRSKLGLDGPTANRTTRSPRRLLQL